MQRRQPGRTALVTVVSDVLRKHLQGGRNVRQQERRGGRVPWRIHRRITPSTRIAVLMIAVALISCAVLHGQMIVAEPGLLAGVWEVSGSTGIDGLHFHVSTHEGAVPTPSSQTIDLRIYHRRDKKETSGWYRVPFDSGDAAATFDGQLLRLHNNRSGMALFLTFDRAGTRWIGTWDRNGQPEEVVLERPRPAPGTAPSPFHGEWEGLPDREHGRYVRTRLHMAESVDRTLTAWMDRFLAPIDQRHGEWLRVVSATRHAIVLETTAPGGALYRYEGTLSADASTLTGAWAVPGGGGNLNAAHTFRRAK
jgi:hypothetical protein